MSFSIYNISYTLIFTIRSSFAFINISLFGSNQGFFFRSCSLQIKQSLTFWFACCFSPRISDLDQQTLECFMFIMKLVSVCLKRRCRLYEAGINPIPSPLQLKTHFEVIDSNFLIHTYNSMSN